MKLSTTFKIFKTFVVSMMLIVIMIGCFPTKPEPKPTQFDNTRVQKNYGNPKIVVINGCEYIESRTYSGYYVLTPNMKPLFDKIDSLKQEINELKKLKNK